MIRKEAILIGIVAWIIITLLFSKFDGASDGWTLIGIPWYFYAYTEEKIIIFNTYREGFDFSSFILDLSSLAVFIYVINFFISRNLKKIDTKTNQF